jgi:hypothetical protein
MANNQIEPAPSQEPNQISDEELEAVAGGGIIDGIKDLAKDVYEAGKDVVSDTQDAIETIKKTL